MVSIEVKIVISFFKMVKLEKGSNLNTIYMLSNHYMGFGESKLKLKGEFQIEQ